MELGVPVIGLNFWRVLIYVLTIKASISLQEISDPNEYVPDVKGMGAQYCGGFIPRFSMEPNQTQAIVAPRTAFTLRCLPNPESSNYHPSIRWSLNGRVLDSDSHNFGITTKENGLLHIQIFRKRKHAGIYQCHLSTSCGSILSRSINVSQADSTYSPPITTLPVLALGDTAFLACNLPAAFPHLDNPIGSALAKPRILHNGAPFSFTPSKHLLLPSGLFIIRNLTQQDFGSYTCWVRGSGLGNFQKTGESVIVPALTNSAITRESQADESTENALQVQGQNYKLKSLVHQMIQVAYGESISLPCYSPGLWYAPQNNTSNSSLPLTLIRSIDEVLSNGTLLLKAVHQNTTLYCVSALDRALPRNVVNALSFHLSVNLVPRIANSGVKIIDAPTSSVELSCTFTGLPHPEVRWFRAGRALPTSSQLEITTDTNLLFNALPAVRSILALTPSSSNLSDSASNLLDVYQCFATNRVGSYHQELRVSSFNARNATVTTTESVNVTTTLKLLNDELKSDIATKIKLKVTSDDSRNTSKQPIVTLTTSDSNPTSGSSLSLACKIEAFANRSGDLTLTWLKGGTNVLFQPPHTLSAPPIISSTNHSNWIISQLSFSKTSPLDSGRYTCVAVQETGEQSASLTVRVLETRTHSSLAPPSQATSKSTSVSKLLKISQLSMQINATTPISTTPGGVVNQSSHQEPPKIPLKGDGVENSVIILEPHEGQELTSYGRLRDEIRNKLASLASDGLPLENDVESTSSNLLRHFLLLNAQQNGLPQTNASDQSTGLDLGMRPGLNSILDDYAKAKDRPSATNSLDLKTLKRRLRKMKKEKARRARLKKGRKKAQAAPGFAIMEPPLYPSPYHHPDTSELTSKSDMVPPTAPEVSQLTNTSVMLTWTVPPNDGLKIIFFKLQYRQLQASLEEPSDWMTVSGEVRAKDRAAPVPGLKPGAVYKFRVAAVYENNDNRHGHNSAKFKLAHRLSSTPTLDALPKTLDAGFNVSATSFQQTPLYPPVILNVVPESLSRFRVEWQSVLTEPATGVQAGGQQVLNGGYYVYYRPAGSVNPYVRVGPITPLNVTQCLVDDNLISGSRYEIRVISFVQPSINLTAQFEDDKFRNEIENSGLASSLEPAKSGQPVSADPVKLYTKNNYTGDLSGAGLRLSKLSNPKYVDLARFSRLIGHSATSSNDQKRVQNGQIVIPPRAYYPESIEHERWDQYYTYNSTSQLLKNEALNADARRSDSKLNDAASGASLLLHPASNRLFYIVLGCVLGCLLIVLAASTAACYVKQRKYLKLHRHSSYHYYDKYSNKRTQHQATRNGFGREQNAQNVVGNGPGNMLVLETLRRAAAANALPPTSPSPNAHHLALADDANALLINSTPQTDCVTTTSFCRDENYLPHPPETMLTSTEDFKYRSLTLDARYLNRRQQQGGRDTNERKWTYDTFGRRKRLAAPSAEISSHPPDRDVDNGGIASFASAPKTRSRRYNDANRYTSERNIPRAVCKNGAGQASCNLNYNEELQQQRSELFRRARSAKNLHTPNAAFSSGERHDAKEGSYTSSDSKSSPSDLKRNARDSQDFAFNPASRPNCGGMMKTLSQKHIGPERRNAPVVKQPLTSFKPAKRRTGSSLSETPILEETLASFNSQQLEQTMTEYLKGFDFDSGRSDFLEHHSQMMICGSDGGPPMLEPGGPYESHHFYSYPGRVRGELSCENLVDIINPIYGRFETPETNNAPLPPGPHSTHFSSERQGSVTGLGRMSNLQADYFSPQQACLFPYSQYGFQFEATAPGANCDIKINPIIEEDDSSLKNSMQRMGEPPTRLSTFRRGRDGCHKALAGPQEFNARASSQRVSALSLNSSACSADKNVAA